LAAGRYCSGATCLQPLPKSLQVGPAELARMSREQQQKLQARMGVPIP
jgi:hypothetical protein